MEEEARQDDAPALAIAQQFAERHAAVVALPRLGAAGQDILAFFLAESRMLVGIGLVEPEPGDEPDKAEHANEIGRASCRARVCPYGKISVVAVTLKNKTY